MQTLELLRRKIESVEDLKAIVRTMKTLAAVSIRHYERAAQSLADFDRAIQMGLQVVLKEGGYETPSKPPHGADGLGAIVLGSDQGLCGRFNDQVVSHALVAMDELEPRRDRRMVMCVGARAFLLLGEAGHGVEDLSSVPSSISGITPKVQEILIKLGVWQSKKIDRVLLFFNRLASGVFYRPHTISLLPLDGEWLRGIAEKPWPSRVLPTFTMDRDRLFSSLVRQHLFVSLYRAFAESLASENASCLASMQVAERNIEEHLEEIKTQFRHQRQTSITEELLDIVAGFEALANGGDDGSFSKPAG
jgi:F-type H+-transporting ATPase subunit gamma